MPEPMEAKTTENGPFQSPWNFLGLPEELSAPARARAWVMPIPYEGATSYGAGTRTGRRRSSRRRARWSSLTGSSMASRPRSSASTR